jgi:hypothetical protein
VGRTLLSVAFDFAVAFDLAVDLDLVVDPDFDPELIRDAPARPPA